MKTLHDGLSLRIESQEPKYPLGAYLKRWAIMRGISQMDMARALGYNERYGIWRTKRVSLYKFLDMVEYLSKNSGLSEEFYLARLKQVIKGEYKWRD